MSSPVLDRFGDKAVGVIEGVGLLVILVATVIAAGQEIWHMVSEAKVHLTDLLLLFIYLEVVAMVAAYWQSGQLPVRMPLYIAMVALARYLILDMKHLDEWRILAISVAVLLLAVTVLVLRFGHTRYPYGPTDSK